ncbi:MAG: hypothetical protein ABSF34_22580 [Verrucomicrobiota bacterium]
MMAPALPRLQLISMINLATGHSRAGAWYEKREYEKESPITTTPFG